jgi:hypothetical protein
MSEASSYVGPSAYVAWGRGSLCIVSLVTSCFACASLWA